MALDSSRLRRTRHTERLCKLPEARLIRLATGTGKQGRGSGGFRSPRGWAALSSLPLSCARPLAELCSKNPSFEKTVVHGGFGCSPVGWPRTHAGPKSSVHLCGSTAATVEPLLPSPRAPCGRDAEAGQGASPAARAPLFTAPLLEPKNARPLKISLSR